LFPWAHAQRAKSAVKLHTLVDLRGNIPCFIRVSTAKTPDCTVLDHLPIEAGAYYVMDRGYNDYRRLHRLTRAGAFFVVRGKSNLAFIRCETRKIDRDLGLRSDQTIRLKDRRTTLKYPDRLRRIHYYDVEHQKRFIFITNDFQLPALTIANLYRCRWQVELFFKWIKQNLRIQHFMGNSINAVKTQVWIAISTYVLVAIVKKQLRLPRTMSEILQVLSVALFEKMPLNAALFTVNSANTEVPIPNQLRLFDL
jgi:IS4 transposase